MQRYSFLPNVVQFMRNIFAKMLFSTNVCQIDFAIYPCILQDGYRKSKLESP